MLQSHIENVWLPMKSYCTQVYQEISVGMRLISFLLHKMRSADKKVKPGKASVLHLPRAVINSSLSPLKMKNPVS